MNAVKIQKSETFPVEVKWETVSGKKCNLICKPHHIGNFHSGLPMHMYKLINAKPFTNILSVGNKMPEDYFPNLSINTICGTIHLNV
jgi:hypothetical protein